MDAVILFSHGSLLCGAGEALQAHAERLRAAGLAPTVEVGYLNYSRPLFSHAVDRCVAAGATRIVVTPYFLVPGKFVTTDLPAAIASESPRYPDVEFLVAEPIGFDEALPVAIEQAAREAVPAAYWSAALSRLSESCRGHAACPLYATEQCPKGPLGHADTAREVTASHMRYQPYGTAGPSVTQGSAERGGQAPKHEPPDTAPSGSDLTAFTLLVVAHGSPRAEANADLHRVIDRLAERGRFKSVGFGFLECNAPSIPDAIDACVLAGATRLIVAPYFLHPGAHVLVDIPDILHAAALRHEGVEIRMAPYLGLSPELTGILANRADTARSSRNSSAPTPQP